MRRGCDTLCAVHRRAWIICAALAACGGGSDGGVDGGSVPTGDGGAGGSDGGSGGGGGGADAGGTGTSIQGCWEVCAVAGDCGTGTAITDADNYECDDGRCRWLGCNSTPECTAAFGTAGYVCAAVAGGLPTCVPACDVAGDCALVGGGAYDADNYRCTGGACEWTGCNSTAECNELPGGPYVCARSEGAAFDSCLYACAMPADCDQGTPLASADNYECVDGACRWTGCNDSSECTGAFMSPDYVCY